MKKLKIIAQKDTLFHLANWILEIFFIIACIDNDMGKHV